MDDFLELIMARHQSLTELAVTQEEDDEMAFCACVWLLLFMLEEETLTLGFFMLALGFFTLEEAREEPEEMLTFNFWMREEAREEEPEEETLFHIVFIKDNTNKEKKMQKRMRGGNGADHGQEVESISHSQKPKKQQAS